MGGNFDGTWNGVEDYNVTAIGSGAVTNGSTSYIDVANITSTSYALSTWVGVFDDMLLGLFGFDSIITGEPSASIPRIIGLDLGNDGGTSGFRTYQFPVNSFPVDGNFFHLVVSVSNNEGAFFINGIQQTMIEGTVNRFMNYSGGGFLGRMSESYQFFKNAKFDQLRIFNRALTPQEVEILYQEGQ